MAATVGAALAAVGAMALPGPLPAGADPAGDPIVIDHGGAPRDVPLADPPPGLPPDAAAGAFAAVAAPGQGFTPFRDDSFNHGSYRLELVNSAGAGAMSQLRSAVAEAADDLEAITNVEFVVAPGTVPQPSNHDDSLFAFGESGVGVIRVAFDSDSRCGPLEPHQDAEGALACGGPDYSGGSFAYRGHVWISPLVLAEFSAFLDEVVAHEIGHALGLDHFTDRFPLPSSARQLMFPQLHTDPTDTPFVYHAGDVNGVRYMHHPLGYYLTATYRDFLGRIPDNGGYRFWLAAPVSSRDYVVALSTSSEWIGLLVDRFYLDVFGRTASASESAFWSGRIRTFGVPFVAAELYGSNEYFQREGGTNTGFLDGLYQDLLGRAPSQAEVNGWLGALPTMGRTAVAFSFYQSPENRGYRVDDLYCSLLDRATDPSGRAFWAERILTDGDLSLAVELATSVEYFDRREEFALRDGDLPPPCAGF